VYKFVARAIRQEKEKIQKEKEEVKLSYLQII
jgi:hypothetical protein